MKIPQNKTLLKIAVCGGVGAISAAMWMKYKIEEGIKNSEYYRLALKTLRQHKGAVSLLGEPIKEGGFDLATPEMNFCDGEKAQFEVKVKGPKDKGNIFFWASRSPEDGWILNQLELELKGHPGKRYVLKKNDTETEHSNLTDLVSEYKRKTN